MSSTDRDASTARDPLASGASIGSPRVDESPRLVTRGETHERDKEAASGAALVDWLAFTLRPAAGQHRTWLQNAISTVFCVPREGWLARSGGWFGYTNRLELGPFGFLAYGGSSQRETLHVSLNGHACALVQDWNAVRLWGETYGAAITRADAAHDDMDARDIDVQRACEWWRLGKFNSNGRPPKAHLEDDMGLGSGKTLYVGSRASGKLLRIYERGKKLGSSSSLWVRAEVELRNKGRVVPWDIVTAPGQYLAGAYPALRVLSTTQLRLRTTRRTAELGYEAMVRNLRVQGGKSVNVMCKVHQGDTAAVVARLVREGVPKRLVGIPERVIAALEGSVA
jgi:phage replication initiation protein